MFYLFYLCYLVSAMPAQAKIDRLAGGRGKKTAGRRRKTKPFFLLRRFLLLAGAALLVGIFWKSFSSWQDRLWIPGARFTVLVAEEDPTLYSYNPKSKELFIISFPANTEVEAARGLGTYLLGKLWALGEQENLSGELLASSVSRVFGLPIDGWMGPGGKSFFEPAGLSWPAVFLKAVFSGLGETNLTFFDRLNTLLEVAPVSRVYRKEISLEDKKVIVKSRLSDGVAGFKVVPEQARVVFEVLQDEAVFEEGKTVEIVNATDKTGLGTSVAGVLSTLGARVVGTQTRREDVDDCVVRFKKSAAGSLTARKIVGILKCGREEKDSGAFADIEVLLGEKFAKRF